MLTALAAPVDEGIMLAAVPGPPHQSFEDGPVGSLLGDGCGVCDDAELVVHNRGEGARQSVVHEALETMSMYDVYLSSLISNTNMCASAEGAEMITLFAPPLKCAKAFSLVVKTACIAEMHYHDVIGSKVSSDSQSTL